MSTNIGNNNDTIIPLESLAIGFLSFECYLSWECFIHVHTSILWSWRSVLYETVIDWRSSAGPDVIARSSRLMTICPYLHRHTCIINETEPTKFTRLIFVSKWHFSFDNLRPLQFFHVSVFCFSFLLGLFYFPKKRDFFLYLPTAVVTLSFNAKMDLADFESNLKDWGLPEMAPRR